MQPLFLLVAEAVAVLVAEAVAVLVAKAVVLEVPHVADGLMGCIGLRVLQ